MTEILSDIVAEGERLLDQAGRDGVRVRLLGGVAVRLQADEAVPATFARTYNDLDFVTAKASSGDAQRFFRAAGYVPHVGFNALNSRERLLFFDEEHDRQVDVFVGEFRMCHRIPLDGRLDVDARTIPLAELLLTKLQIIEVNEKDVRDALTLLHGHPVDEHDDGAINARRVAELCAADWGLWRTITQNLRVCAEHLDRYELAPGERERAAKRVQALLDRIEAEPKGRAWRLRAKVGDRRRWYDLPEEVGGGA